MDKTNEIGNAIQQKIDFVQDEIIDKINQRVRDSYEALELIGFSEIYLRDNFDIEIKRKSGVKANFSELSGMERVLLGIIITFSTLKAFYPDFPIFAIDDPLNAADDIRFKNLMKFSTKQSVNLQSNKFEKLMRILIPLKILMIFMSGLKNHLSGFKMLFMKMKTMLVL